jgi:uncharacterized coiled-coil DUF342 family protein
MAEPENHTLHLLREMRDESRAFRKEMRDGLEQARQDRQEMRGQLDSIQSVFSGMAYLQADQRGQIEELAQRVERIEDKIGLTGTPAE